MTPELAKQCLDLMRVIDADLAAMARLRDRAAVIFDTCVTRDDRAGEWAAAASRYRDEAQAFIDTLTEIRGELGDIQTPVQPDGKEQP